MASVWFRTLDLLGQRYPAIRSIQSRKRTHHPFKRLLAGRELTNQWPFRQRNPSHKPSFRLYVTAYEHGEDAWPSPPALGNPQARP